MRTVTSNAHAAFLRWPLHPVCPIYIMFEKVIYQCLFPFCRLSRIWGVLLFLFLASCASPTVDPSYVARLGESMLTSESLQEALDAQGIGTEDSAEASQQIIQEWVRTELLFQEANRLGLGFEDEVQRLIEQNERSVLVSAFLNRLYSADIAQPAPEEVEAYFNRNLGLLELRENYLRVRYLFSTSRDSATLARQAMQEATINGSIDEAWPTIAANFGIDPEASVALSEQYYPVSRLFAAPLLRDQLLDLEQNQIAPLIEDGGLYHLLQVADIRPAGSTPEFEWLEEELTERVTIEHRKQLVARQVQRLRNEAMNRGDLELKEN